jgi:L-threonylcarbamoyladenylate synthase
MLPSHYAPDAPVILCDDRNEADLEVRRLIDEGRVVALVWRENPRDYATRLYDDLRAADDIADIIVAVLPPPVGIGLAVRDRLSRAAHPREGDVTVR